MFTILKSNQIKSNVAFWRLDKTGISGEKPIGSEKGINLLSPLMTPSLGIEPGPHWWKASADTTAPTLLH